MLVFAASALAQPPRPPRLVPPPAMPADQPLMRPGEDGAMPPTVEEVPKGAIARLGSIRFRTSQPISRVAFSPDGKHIVVGGTDGRVTYWNATTGQVEHSLAFAGGTITRLTFSADGKYLAVAGHSGFVGVFEAATRKRTLLTTPVNGQYYTRAIAWRDAKSLAVADAEGLIRILDPVTGEELKNFRTELRNIASIACSPDGKELVALSSDARRMDVNGFEGHLQAWSIDDGKPSVKFDKPEPVAGGPNEFAMPGRPPGMRTPFYPAAQIAWSPDGKHVVAGTMDRQVPVWDAKTGKVVRQFRTPTFGINLAFFPNSRFLVASGNAGHLHIFGIASGAELRTIDSSRDPTNDVAVSPDGSLIATVGSGATIRVIEVNTGHDRSASRGHKGAIAGLAFLADGRLVSGGHDQTMIVWEVPGAKEVERVTHSEFRVTSMAPSVDGKGIVFTGALQYAMAWSPGMTQSRRLTPNSVGGHSPAVAPDGRISIHPDAQSIRIYETETGRDRPRIAAQRNYFNAANLAASPFARYVAATAAYSDRRITVWNAADGKTRLTLTFNEEQPFYPNRLVFSPDTRLLVSIGTNHEVRVWETATGAQRLRVLPDGAAYSSVAFTPDGGTLVLGTATGTLRLYDLSGGGTIAPLAGHLGEVRVLAVSADGKYLASGGADTTTVIWNLPELLKRVPRLPLPAQLNAEKLDHAWAGLGSNDPYRAGAALWTLGHSPKEALALFKERLRGVKAPDKEKIQQWLKELDDDRFTARERAYRNLLAIGEDAKPFLETALAQNPSLEAKRRVEQLLKGLTKGIPARKLQPLRAIALLEKFDGPEVKSLLEELAKESTDDDVKQEIEWVLSRKASGAKP